MIVWTPWTCFCAFKPVGVILLFFAEIRNRFKPLSYISQLIEVAGPIK